MSSEGGVSVSESQITQMVGKSVRWLEDASRFPDSLEAPIHGWVASKRPASGSRSGGDEVKGGEAVNDWLGAGYEHRLEAGPPRLGRAGLLIAPIREGNTLSKAEMGLEKGKEAVMKTARERRFMLGLREAGQRLWV